HPLQNATSPITPKSLTGYALAFCFAMLAISPITIMSYLLRTPDAELFIRSQLVDASFHVNAKECRVNKIDNSKIAYTEAGKAIIAIPDDNLGYIFKRIECSRDWEKPEQVESEYEESSEKHEKPIASAKP